MLMLILTKKITPLDEYSNFYLFQKNHKEYVKKLEEVESMKKSYLQQFQKFNKTLASTKQTISKWVQVN